MKNWQTRKAKIVHQNPWFQINQNDVIRPDGSLGQYFILETKGASVFVVVVNTQNEVLLIGQERYANGTFSWEIPGGNSEGEDPLHAAKRELVEETGVEAKTWINLGISYPMNGLSSEKSYTFIAKDITQNTINHQLEEGITRSQWVTPAKAFEMIKKGEITDNQTITGLTKAFVV